MICTRLLFRSALTIEDLLVRSHSHTLSDMKRPAMSRLAVRCPSDKVSCALPHVICAASSVHVRFGLLLLPKVPGQLDSFLDRTEAAGDSVCSDLCERWLSVEAGGLISPMRTNAAGG